MQKNNTCGREFSEEFDKIKDIRNSQWSSVVRPHTPQVYASHSLQSRILLNDDYKMQLLESGTIKICISVDTKVH